MSVALQIVQIVMSITIIVLVLLQAKGSSLGSMFGGDGGVYRTKRGAEKIIYQATIGLGVLFSLFSIISVILTT